MQNFLQSLAGLLQDYLVSFAGHEGWHKSKRSWHVYDCEHCLPRRKGLSPCAGLFVSLNGYQRHGLVHHTQVSEEIAFGQEDEDDDKVTAMEYFFPQAARVRTSSQLERPWVTSVQIHSFMIYSFSSPC